MRQRVVSADFHVCDRDSAVRWLIDAAPADGVPASASYVCVANVTDIMDARQDPAYAEALGASGLTIPDGKPVVWALRSAGHPIRHNVRGADLMQQALDCEAIAGRRHVLIGASPKAREGVRRRFPDVNWVGEIDFTYDDLDDPGYASLAAKYDELQADYAWVSLGGGKQVRFMHRFVPLVERGVFLGIGAAIDFHAGLTPQAPRWMQTNGLEWLYRLGSEPRRLWRRYLVHNPPFLYHWVREMVVGQAAAPEVAEPAYKSRDAALGVSMTANGPRRLATGRTGVRHPSSAPRGRTRPRPVSVVVPLFNEAACVDGLMDSLGRLESLLARSYDLEFVLVDDGSTDDTVARLRPIVADLPRYRLIRHEQNRGISAAIFTGIKQATHETVASIDADGSYDLSILQGMLPLTTAATPMVTASPYHPLGGVEGAPGWRIALSRGASGIYSLVMPQRLNCYTACFRTYNRQLALQCETANDGFTGVAELAWRVQRIGGDVAEYPAVLRARQAGVSKMRVGRTALAHGRLMSRIALASCRDRLFGPPAAVDRPGDAIRKTPA
ncbi:MAG: WecB/TagA/CpsF family glycosyltransferase [Planctomycetota bacterium]